MHHRSLLCALIITLLFAAGCTPPGPNPDQMIAAAKELDQKFLEAFNAQDVDKVMDLYLNSPDVISFPVGGKLMLKGWDEIKADVIASFAMMKGSTLTVSEAHYQAAGDVVLTWGLWHLTMPMPDGTTMQMDGRYTDAKKEHNGKWVFIMDHPSVPLPPPPAAPMQ